MKVFQFFSILLLVLLSLAGCLSVDVQEEVSRIDTAEYRAPVDLNAAEAAPRALIPFPREVIWNSGEQPLSQCSVKKSIGKLPFSDSPEAYSLTVGNGRVDIMASSERGIRYAELTLNQLSEGGRKPLPSCVIRDWPAFEIRGFHQDTGRNYQSPERLKEQIRRLAAYKLNTFHWHITDNPGWRVECKAYPVLNDPKTMYRSDSFYTYDEIRDVIAFAKEQGMQIIIELDMPGHSKYFPKAFGFSMGSKRGTQICRELIREFCEEIPVEDAPIIHIGADEVRAPVIDEFMAEIEAELKANNRIGMVWHPGIPAPASFIDHIWFENHKQSGRKSIDSSGMYTNTLDYFNVIQAIYFKQPCEVPEGSEFDLGAIVCNWNDVAVADERDPMLNNPVYASGLTGAEIFWNGNPTGSQRYKQVLPPTGSEALRAFAEFENRLLIHKELYFNDVGGEFVYTRQADQVWQLTGPNGETAEARGVSLLLGDYFPNAKKRQAALCRLEVFADEEKEVLLRAGFDVPGRAHRFYGGVPPKGKWDRYGSTITLNGEPVAPPEWKQPGAYRHDIVQTWDNPVQEVPWTAEELYWRREPVKVTLKKGVNVFEVRAVRNSPKQIWMTALWIEEIETR